jgi:hypothetical protein
MVGGIWTVDPTRKAHVFVLDLLVGWPAVTALVVWGMG